MRPNLVHITTRIGPIVYCKACPYLAQFTPHGLRTLRPGDGAAHTGDAFRAWAGWERLTQQEGVQ